MRYPSKTRLLALAAAILTFSPFALWQNQANAGPGFLKLSTLVYSRAPTQGAPLVRMPLPYTLAEDQAGNRFEGNSKGELDLRNAKGSVKISLNSKYFRIVRLNEEYSKTLSEAEIARGGEISFTDQDAPLGARMCRAHLERARATTLSALEANNTPPWFFTQVTCDVDFDEGCNAGWDGAKLVFHQGNNRCRPASHVADLIYHEYGHGVGQKLINYRKSLQPLDDRLAEGLADTFASHLTQDNKIGLGFWMDRQMTWLRDLSQKRVFPRDYRGTYTGGETYSTAWWELSQELRSELGPAKGTLTSLHLYLKSLLAYHGISGLSDLESAGSSAVETVSAQGVQLTLPRLNCSAAAIFSEHGLWPEQGASNCQPADHASSNSSGPKTTQKINLLAQRGTLKIPDGSKPAPGPWVKLPYCLALQKGQRVEKVVLHQKIDHLFSDDLQIGWADTQGRLHEFFKGEEEIPLPTALWVPDAPACGSIVFRDLSQMFTGEILQAELEFTLGL